MKRLMIALPMAALCAGMVFAQTPNKAAAAPKAVASGDPVADELKKMENDWLDAEKTKNPAKLGDILDDSWIGLDWDGQKEDKTKALADLKEPGSSLTSYTIGPMTVRIFGSTAVVTGSDTEKGTEKGKDSSGKYIWTDVFVKVNGKWKAVASQTGKVAN